MLTTLLTVVLVLVVIGFLLWLVLNYIPMPEPFKKVIIAFVVLLLVLWIVRVLFGVGPALRGL